MGKKNYKLCNKNYYDDKIINFKNYLAKDDIVILNKFDIFLEDREYTEYEFDVIEEKIFLYYSDKNKEELKEFFLKNEINFEQYRLLLEKFNKIASDYKI